MTRLFGTSYSTEYMIQKCFPFLPNAEERVDCEVMTLENARSFWSLIARMQLKWKNEEDAKKLPSSVFIKIPTISSNVIRLGAEEEEINELKETLVDLTRNEETFYRAMKDVKIAGFPYPKRYHGEEVNEVPGREGCLVLEDFSGRALSADYIPGFTLPQVEAVIDALAAWHAFVIEEQPQLCDQFDTSKNSKFLDESFQQLLFGESKKLEEWCPEWFEGRIDPLEKYYSLEYAVKSVRSYLELDIPPVLVHMDMNTTNILWKKNTEKSSHPEIAAVIDFQQIHTGNLCEDLARVLQLGISAEMRKNNEERLLKRYHEKLSLLLGSKTVISLESVHAAYRRIFPYVANFALFAVTCYYSMYNDLEKDEKMRVEKQRELLSRARGIVDDCYKHLGLE